MQSSLLHYEDTAKVHGLHTNQEAMYEWITKLRIFLGAGFYRNVRQLASLHYQCIYCFPSIWKRTRWAWDRKISLPGVPKDKAAFDNFLRWIKGIHYKTNKYAFWELVEMAKLNHLQMFRKIVETGNLVRFMGEAHWNDPFITELAQWLASFLPSGKPVMECEGHRPIERWHVKFPDGFVYRTPAFIGSIDEWIRNMDILLETSPPKNAVFYYGKETRLHDLELYALTLDGWFMAIFSDPESKGDAMTLWQGATHWTRCESPLQNL